MTYDESITLELCYSTEWLTVFGGYIERDGDQLDDEAAGAFRDRLRYALSSRFPNADVEPAKGQRYLCHGWNGAQFTHRMGPVGTWDHLTAAQVAAIHEAINEACQ